MASQHLPQFAPSVYLCRFQKRKVFKKGNSVVFLSVPDTQLEA